MYVPVAGRKILRNVTSLKETLPALLVRDALRSSAFRPPTLLPAPTHAPRLHRNRGDFSKSHSLRLVQVGWPVLLR
jgi:hypothetical protein